MGFDVPLDDGVESAAGKFAEKLGQKPGSVCSFVIATREPKGSTLVVVSQKVTDLGRFQMARLLAKVSVTKKLDIVLIVPLKEAEKYLSMTMIHL